MPCNTLVRTPPKVSALTNKVRISSTVWTLSSPRCTSRPGHETDDQHGRDGEPNGGERRAETDIDRALKVIAERRVERGEPLG